MTYSTVPTKFTGDTLAANDWNTYVRDNLADHEARIGAIAYSGCRVTRVTDQAIADNTLTAVTWTAETTDQGGWFPGTGTTATVPASALPSGYTTLMVSMAVQIYWESSSTGSRSVLLLKNGTEFANQKIVPGFTGTFAQVFTAPDIDAVPGDTFVVQVGHSSGASLNVAGATRTAAMSIRRVGYY